MKTMTCKQLGGACEEAFHAATFEEMGELSKKHAMDMVEKKDEVHLKAMDEMRELMQKPEAIQEWMGNKQKEFDALPEDK